MATNGMRVAQHPETAHSHTHDMCDDPPPPYNEREPEVHSKERLRRFLSYCLAVDYGLEETCPDKLRKDDWYHFTRLSLLCYTQHRSSPSAQAPIMFDWPAISDSAQLDRELFAGADALKVPRCTVVAMLRMFVSCTGVCRNRNSSTIGYIGRRYGVHVLAEKLRVDRAIMFGAVLPRCDGQFSQQMLCKHQEAVANCCAHGAIDSKLLASQTSGTQQARSNMGWTNECVRVWFDYRWISVLRFLLVLFHHGSKPAARQGLCGTWATGRQRALFGEPPYPDACCGSFSDQCPDTVREYMSV